MKINYTPFHKELLHMYPFFRITFLLFLISSCGVDKPQEVVEAEKNIPEIIDFNFHVKPILSDRCFACHGPDKNTQKADLRLDNAAGAYAALAEAPDLRAIVPGKPGKSEVYHRIISNDPEKVMPPKESNLTLTPEEIAILTRWIEQGAEYKPHWAFIKPEKPALPELKEVNPNWRNSEIDQFVLAKLQEKNLSPSKEAEKSRLIRRVTFDLTGLPPTIEEIDNFLSDESPDAYEKLVNRLLSSPHYGERMAMEWMDISRYADSHGYSQDGYRMMWPWRDWVINAYNQNMPYYKFISWQIAGDLFPNATREQKLATAFLRNQKLNSEGGIIPEEFMVEYAADRTNTAGTAFMGLTMECARCHDHKYDPISQKNYYELFAFFNNVNERGLVQKDGNSGPTVLLTNEEIEAQLVFLDQNIEKASTELEKFKKNFRLSLNEEKLIKTSQVKLPQPIAYYPFDMVKNKSTPNLINPKQLAGVSEKAILEKGVKGNAISYNQYENIGLGKMAHFERHTPFSFSFWVKPLEAGEYLPIIFKLAGKNEGFYGYEMLLKKNQPSIRLVHKLPADQIQVTTNKKIPDDEFTQLIFTYDGSGKANGINIYINGEKENFTVEFDQLKKSLTDNGKEKNLSIGGKLQFDLTRSGTAFIDELKIFNLELSPIEAAQINAKKLTDLPEADWEKHHLIRETAGYKNLQEKLRTERLAKFSLQDTLPEVMVMEDLKQPKKSYILERGVYDAPGEEVSPSTPAEILPFDESLPKNRLGLAKWITNPDNPLTARVIVNRIWMQFFGTGIVASPEDFGSQGALPTHPELLDWLAIEFIASGWDMKSLIKKMVMSATYRQSSLAPGNLLKDDPDNLWLARGPSFRLSAEMIRDNALAASGLLIKDIGGPSVKPYQPKGLWSEKNTFSVTLRYYVQDHGDNLYKRSLYTFWRRTSPPPSMNTFDAPTRSFCIVKRQRTNTPLQSMVLLNDPQFIEASRKLAERAIIEGGNSTEDKINHAFRLLTSRFPDEKELELLTAIYNEEYLHFSENPADIDELLAVGESPFNKNLDKAEIGAFTIVGNAIMNFEDSFVKR
ncbi:DUF1553 domain-containing protein [Flexithrix dorotheae]|uniref:DUF1553 domain-containing protein n=1 Tax=Flexithrix dorotheae TaxID=70993 RepID=UPI00035D973E|nr:DUF1553 domain-containing protein [Flexithrix dorotheae]